MLCENPVPPPETARPETQANLAEPTLANVFALGALWRGLLEDLRRTEPAP
jgi:hypothetical protein